MGPTRIQTQVLAKMAIRAHGVGVAVSQQSSQSEVRRSVLGGPREYAFEVLGRLGIRPQRCVQRSGQEAHAVVVRVARQVPFSAIEREPVAPTAHVHGEQERKHPPGVRTQVQGRFQVLARAH